MPQLTRINIYPVKSLDPQSVDEAVVLASGALANDRRYALVDRSGEWVNGKRTPAVQRLRSRLDFATGRLTLTADSGETREFHVEQEQEALTRWLSAQLGETVSIIENTAGGFPDDVESPGPTLISTATLAEVASWYPGLSVDETRDRFRANLEIDAPEPFWEDRLVPENLGGVRFAIGAVELVGANPCARCPVPTRNPYTGVADRQFARTFAERRREKLPSWAPASRFDHYYRLAVNTRPARSRESALRLGDELRILGTE
ncbi:MAG: MOSC domain-containing protein [Pirellulales bacterium]